MLALQGGALVYLISRMEVRPGPPPPEVTRLIARDLGEALTEQSAARHPAVLPAGVRRTAAARRHHEGRPGRHDRRRHRAVRRLGARDSQPLERLTRLVSCADEPGEDVAWGRGRMDPKARAAVAGQDGQGRRGGSRGRRHCRWRAGRRGDCDAVDSASSGSSARRSPSVGAVLVAVGTTAAALLDFRPGASAAAKPRGRCAQSRRGRFDARAHAKTAATRWRRSPMRSIR